MTNPTPLNSQPDLVRNIAIDILLTLVTCGIYNIYIQYKQIQALNILLNQEKYQFVTWALLTLVTCGIYHLYHEYRMSDDLCRLVSPQNPNGSEPILCLVVSLLGAPIVADAIQQSRINQLFGNNKL